MNWKSHLFKIKAHTGLNTVTASSTLRPVDIIITVYNGYDTIRKCIDSVLQHTDSQHAIYIYNDASTDSRIKPYLDSIAQQHRHISVTHHKENLGYLANVNQAMAKSRHDVVLLNSDTEVTDNWLDEIRIIAAEDNIGAVCPLSDDATILSLKNHQAHQIKRLKTLTGLWYDIPTVVGFCVLIKRRMIQKLGGFDNYYAPGYGEECDYSMRLRQAGFHVAAAPAAFVYHQGSQSFKKSADKLKNQHQKLLELRWPNYNQEIQSFIRQNPARYINNLIEQAKQKTKVLHVVHGLENKGGVELFTLELLQKLGSDCQHDVLSAPIKNSKTKANIRAALGPDIRLIELQTSQPQGFIYTHRSDLFNGPLDLAFTRLLLFGRYDVVHFHSLVGVGSMLWPLICRHHKVPYVLFFHDHFGLCQVYSLVTEKSGQEGFCGRNHMSASAQICRQCIQKKTKFNTVPQADYMQQRIEIWSSILAGSRRNYFSSHYLLNQYLKRYPDSLAKNQVFPPCFLPTKSLPRKINSRPVKIAFLGHFTAFKGAHVFLEAKQEFKNQTKLEWHIIGGIESKFKATIEQQRIGCTGAFTSTDLPELLADIDLVVQCSVFPESYSITLSEALYAGIPVIAPKIGAFPERVNQGNGLLFEPENGCDLARKIHYFIDRYDDPDFLPEINFEKAAKTRHVKDLDAFYTQVAKSSNKPYAAAVNTLLAPPNNSAYQQMSQWLDAPLTLEAEPDWKIPDSGLQVCIIGRHLPAIECTRRSIQQHINEPQFIAVENIKEQTNPVLVLLAGTVVNDNLGNWLTAFKQAQKTVGLADFSLINQQQQCYAPHFQQQFSEINHLANHQAVGALLIQPTLLDDDAWSLIQDQDHGMSCLQVWLQNTLDKKGNSAIHYFPHYSYALSDLQWVKNWKLAQEPPKPANYSAHILLVMESNQPAEEIRALLHSLRLQKGLQQISIVLLTDNILSSEINDVIILPRPAGNQKNSLINQQLTSTGADYVLLINDNILINDLWCLNCLLFALIEFKLDAVSPPAARSRNKHQLIGNKMGGGLYFYSKGVVADSTFHLIKHPIEYDLLDEDCILIKRKAWLKVQPELTACYFYQIFRMSQLLAEQGYRSGLIAVPGLSKKGLPSHCKTTPVESLEHEREEIINQCQQFKPLVNYSNAYSNRTSRPLDVDFGTFKTPKNLPRIIAYGHDAWASGFYRVKSPLSALAAKGLASVHFLPENNAALFPTPYEINKMHADCLLLHNCFSDRQLAHIKQFKQQLHAPIIISLDDLLTQVPDDSPVIKKIPKDILSKLKTAFELADRVIVSSDYLADHYRALSDDIRVIPNFISEQVWPIHKHKTTINSRLRIGWAGGGQHRADLDWLTPVIKATKDQVQWVFFGDKPAQVSFNWIEYHPPVAFAKYHQKLTSLNLDIGIAPLIDIPFNQAKSPLKLLEYGALGLAVIASDITPYTSSPAIQLDNNTDKWIACIDALCQSPNTVKNHGKKLSEWVINNHILERNLDHWKSVLGL